MKISVLLAALLCQVVAAEQQQWCVNDKAVLVEDVAAEFGARVASMAGAAAEAAALARLRLHPAWRDAAAAGHAAAGEHAATLRMAMAEAWDELAEQHEGVATARDAMEDGAAAARAGATQLFEVGARGERTRESRLFPFLDLAVP